jgi:hypothetical protein
MTGMPPDPAASPARQPGTRAAGIRAAGPWAALRGWLGAAADGLAVPPGPGHGLCLTCRGPAGPGRIRCFQCGLHAESAPGLLADAVVPIAYAPKGGPLARDLWLYKSARPDAAGAAARLRALLLVFLHDHGAAAWQRAAPAPPSHVCVVPSGRGRPGPHPLHELARGYLTLPWAALRPRPGAADSWARWLDPDRFRAARPLPGARVLLLDDTWVSGSTAQAAAVALKRAGAASVATVVLGRHVAAGDLPATAAAGPPLVNRLGR